MLEAAFPIKDKSLQKKRTRHLLIQGEIANPVRSTYLVRCCSITLVNRLPTNR
jgi:hypothetical protein